MWIVQADSFSIVPIREAVKWDSFHLSEMWVTVPSEEKFFLTSRKYGGSLTARICGIADILLPLEGERLMEMQFRITEGSLPVDITVRVAMEIGKQLSIPGNEEGAVVDSDIDNAPGHTAGQEQIFERLATLRRQIASEAGYPPYIIFHDSTLMEMCRLLPKDMHEMKSVQGVVEAKLAKYGQRFLDASSSFQFQYSKS